MPALHTFPFYLLVFGGGLALGLVFAFLAWNNTRVALRERNKFKMMLGEKLEIEASATAKLKTELEALRKQNENLRIKVAELNQAPEKRLQRELEIYARTEKRLVATSPGFPAAWENAKRDASDELALEESGQSLPQRIFQKFTALTSSAAKMPEIEKI
jgi:tRNA A37 N6-isopentenylltransferase MiaA